MGLSLPNSSAQEAVATNKLADARAAGAAVAHLVQRASSPRTSCPGGFRKRHCHHHRPRRLHQCSASSSSDRPRCGHSLGALRTSPALANGFPCWLTRAPPGTTTSELIAIGGIQPLMKMLLQEGLMARGLPHRYGQDPGGEPCRSGALSQRVQRVIRPLSEPIKKDSHLVIPINFASEGAGKNHWARMGYTLRARHGASMGRRRPSPLFSMARSWLVMWWWCGYEGLKGGPGMREMLSPTSAINGWGLSDQVALITDGRFSGAPTASGQACDTGGLRRQTHWAAWRR